MRIALTFNLRRSLREEEAEFDSEETIAMLTGILAGLGHQVDAVEVSCSIEELVDRLRLCAPDLVFNLAEGRRGAFREAFYPALFEELGLAHTGSSASVLALCLDKALAKRVVGAAGVLAPRGQLVRHLSELSSIEPPVIVKPNFEGSSKGITQASVVVEREALRTTVEELLARYPAGVLIEEFVDGMDVSVGWIAGLGVLTPIGYAYEPTGPHRILDLSLKQGPPERVRMEIPAALDGRTRGTLARAAARAFDVLGVRGYGRADFRVTRGGAVRFLEMNPLPSLAASDPELYASVARLGRSPSDLLASIVGAATGGAGLDHPLGS
jgi:D-alanine-D-alanine ligase